MPQQVLSSVENNFTKGLITEATGLNFPENAATSASNCDFTLIGDVVRRTGFNIELNGNTQVQDITNQAINTYSWNTPGGGATSKLLVKQIGSSLYFYNIATSTIANPLSTQVLSQIINISQYTATGGTFDQTIECTFADGQGYLFVFHPDCDPFYVAFDPVNIVLTSAVIPLYIRDFIGLAEPSLTGANSSVRPGVLGGEHAYNLQNQGWTLGNPWSATSGTTYTFGLTGNFTFIVQPGLVIASGTQVGIAYTGPSIPLINLPSGTSVSSGAVVSYSSSSGALTINITYAAYGGFGVQASNWNIVPGSSSPVSTFFAAAGLFPSNSDIWWLYKDSTGAFNPGSTLNNVSFSLGPAPKGHFILNAFNINRASIIGPGPTVVTTTMRPSTGAWFQGRVWYSGVNASQVTSADTNYYNWASNIYFSQVSINDPSVFGSCYQTNDPTSEQLNIVLPTDGGVITIPEAGVVHKLWPIANGMLIFASNGVWFLTGSAGIGFTADDYTITQISKIHVISNKSFVDVLGLPYFWNEEGIYRVMSGQSGQLTVEPITVGTILTFYNSIPLASKKYAHGAYDPINYIIQWVYKTTAETNITDRYRYDSMLSFNTVNQAFYPYVVSPSSNSNFINGITYVSYPYIANATPEPGFKYPSSFVNSNLFLNSFAENYDTSYLDWGSANYTSSFTTGYKLHGQGWRKFQVPYVYVYSRNNGYAAYYIQGAWQYGIDFDSNRWSVPQFSEINDSNSSMFRKRHKIRGRGEVLQLMFTSVQGQPFDIMGWAMYENANASV